jgi:hypothetical protein
MEKTATSPPKPTRQQPANDDERADAISRRAPPPPGMGKLVDKTA